MANTPGIPDPSADVHSLLETVRALKSAVERLQGVSGKDKNKHKINAAPTYQELVDLGILTKYDVPK